ncbi:MAG: hypothetical protein AAFW69_00980, partial [Pseudomonadota bacterium]
MAEERAPTERPVVAAAGRALEAWVGSVAARPRRALAGLLALILLAVWSATGLSVDTDSSRMLDPRLDFQERAQEVNRAFPDLKNAMGEEEGIDRGRKNAFDLRLPRGETGGKMGDGGIGGIGTFPSHRDDDGVREVGEGAVHLLRA